MEDMKLQEPVLKPGLVKWKATSGEENDTRSVLVNASAMAAPFQKKVAHWLRMAATRKLLNCLSEIRGIPVSSLVRKITKKSNNSLEAGIWLHEEAALEFARWLSPSFAVWNNQRTRELLLTGKTETLTGGEPLPAVTSGVLASQVKYVDDVLNEQARKASYHDTVLQSRTLISATLIAKELGMSAIALNKLLHEKKVIYKSGDHWVLYSDYEGNGYTGTKTALYIDSAGKYQSSIHTYWTEKGREFVHGLVRATRLAA